MNNTALETPTCKIVTPGYPTCGTVTLKYHGVTILQVIRFFFANPQIPYWDVYLPSAFYGFKQKKKKWCRTVLNNYLHTFNTAFSIITVISFNQTACTSKPFFIFALVTNGRRWTQFLGNDHLNPYMAGGTPLYQWEFCKDNIFRSLPSKFSLAAISRFPWTG